LKGFQKSCKRPLKSWADWLAGWLTGWLAGWLAGWLLGLAITVERDIYIYI
jgi:hypothetical protein